jgi:DME family drug/metabolite transporter
MNNALYASTILILSCILTAFSRITLKKAMKNSNVLTTMVSSLVFGWIGLGILLLISPGQATYTIKGLAFFALIGVIAPPVVRYFTYIGVDRLGPSRSDSIRSLTPVFAVLFSFFFFSETFKPESIFAVLMIFTGVRLITKEETSEKNKINKFDYIYPFVAAVVAGLISNARKLGMGLETSPLVAAFAAASSAIITFSLFLLYKNKYKQIEVKSSSLKYLAISGIIVSITDVIDLIALKKFHVSLVAPILASTPLFVILMSHFFLKDENINKYVIGGAVFIISGSLFLIKLYT